MAVGLVGGPPLLASVGTLVVLLGHHAVRQTSSVHMPWFVLAALFGLAQSFTINIQVKREARSVSLSDTPFALGLLTVAPAAFVVARVVGGVVSQIVVRRQHRDPVKLTFNLVTSLAEATGGLAVFLVLRGDGMTQPLTWLAAVLGAAVANALSGLAVAVVIAWLESDWPGVRGVAAVVAEAGGRAVPPACIGLVAAMCLGVSMWSAVPLVLVCTTVLAGYRAYARLNERHQSLERLYQFSQVVADHTASDEIFTGMLEHVCELLFADGADLTFFDDFGRPQSELSLRRDQPLDSRSPRNLTTESGWLLDSVRDGRPLLLTRDTKDADARQWL